MKINRRNRSNRIYMKALRMSRTLLRVFRIVAGNVANDAQFPLILRTNIFQNDLSVFLGKIDTLSGRTVYIEPLYAGIDKIPGKRTDAFRGNLSFFIVTSIECRNDACEFFRIFHIVPFFGKLTRTEREPVARLLILLRKTHPLKGLWSCTAEFF